MTVTPLRVPLRQDPKALYECLAEVQRTSITAETIASIALPLPALDPLTALEDLEGTAQPHFYWEHPAAEIAMVALQPIVQLAVREGNRFEQVRQFTTEVLQRTVPLGDLHLSLSGPHFFCSFTFFETSPNDTQRFPSATVFLPQWQVACVQGQGVLVANLRLDATSNLPTLTDTLWQTWRRLQRRHSLKVWCSHEPICHLSPLFPNPHAQARFLKAATATLKTIHQGHLEKLVLAESLTVKTRAPLPLLPTLQTLRERYHECQIFSICDAQGQTFLGASPEQLLKIQDRQLTADALAGSAPRGRTHSEDVTLGSRLLHSIKDIHEHQIVLSFIQERLRGLGITPQATLPAHLLQLPNIQHLRTLVSATLPPSLHLLDVLAALHPTPAVAGTPQDRAEAYLREHECFDRHLYAAPLGWIDYRGNGHFTVGIRSALLSGDYLRLYAGAGIVAESDPHKEWAEVRLKLQTLLQALVDYEVRAVN